MLIGLNGLINSGKGAVSDYLQQKHDFKHLSFADSLKQAVSAIFGWEFEMLKGATPESRQWREEVDQWWSDRLQIRNLTPRWVLQQWGTELGRNSFHPDIWVASLENQIIHSTGNFVIDDCRFKNEMNIIRKNGGILIRINRGSLPEWYSTAMMELTQLSKYGYESGYESIMAAKYPNVHISEWGWVDQPFEYEIENNGTIEELYKKVDDIVTRHK